MELLFTAKEVAERYRVSIETVWRWIRNGELRATPFAAGKGKRKDYRISDTDLEKFQLERFNKGLK